MRVLVTGATGMVGRALLLRLQRDGHQVAALVRSRTRAIDQLGDGVELVVWSEPDDVLAGLVGRADAIVHLAGEPVAGGRWTARRRRALVDSRVGTTRRLVDLMRRSGRRGGVLISASGAGYYGVDVRTPVDERAPAGDGFLARLCVDWEDEASRAGALGARVVLLRLGVVLDGEGGALARLAPLARARLAGRLGDGGQYLPWIHLDDAVEVIVAALADRGLAGPVNVVAGAVTNDAFAKVLGAVVGRRSLPVPALALRAALGEAASIVLGGQHVVPTVLRRQGFAFRWPELAAAVADCVTPSARPCIARSDAATRPEAAAGASHVLVQETVVPAPVDEVFAFFADAGNLALLTPPDLEFGIRTPRPIAMAAGAVIDYDLRIGPAPVRWRTVIDAWEPGRRFVDTQRSGPYRVWWHEHRFTPRGDATLMEDRVYYAVPLGPLGRLAHRLFVGRMLERIFAFRARAIVRRFGAARPRRVAGPVAAPAAATG